MKQSPKPKKDRKGKYGLAWTAVIAVYLILAIVVSCSFGLFDGVIDLFDSGSETTLRDKDKDDDDDRKPVSTTAPNDPEDPWDPEDPEDPEPEAPEEPEPEKPVKPVYTIKVWTPSEDQNSYNNWLTEMQQRFEDAHPEYDILWKNEVMSEGDVGSYVASDISEAADVYMFVGDQLHSLVSVGGLTKLVGDYRYQVMNDNNQLMVDSVTYTDDNQYAFPVANNTWYLYYDKEVFTEEDVRDLDTMLAKGRVYLPLANPWSGGCFFLGTGGTVFGENGRDADAGINFGGENGYKAAKKMVELKANTNVMIGNLDVANLIHGTVDATFCGSWAYSELESVLGDRLGVAMLPTFSIDEETYQMTAMSNSKCIGVNPYAGATEGKLPICVEFASFLASAEAQLARYQARGVVPAHKELRNHPLIQANQMAIAEMDTIAYASALQSALPQMGNYWTPLSNFCDKLRNGYITLDNYEIAVDEMMDAFEDSYW